MVPSDFSNYFLASTGAGAALVGLLFVAISVAPDRFFGRNALPERQAVAASAFSALVNAFFVSLTALIPGTNIGGITVFMGALAVIGTMQQAARLWDGHLRLMHLVRRLSVMAISLVIYGLEIGNGVALLQNAKGIGPVYSLTFLLLTIYGIGLTRAWQLLGAPRAGLLTGLLNPMMNVREDEERASREASLRPEEGALPQGAPVGRHPRQDAEQPHA